jgi:hypothetical protein
MYDLVEWHRRLHGVTGSIAVRFLQVTPNDLTSWAQELHAIAAAMAREARAAAFPESKPPAPVADARPAATPAATPVANAAMPEALQRRLRSRSM